MRIFLQILILTVLSCTQVFADEGVGKSLTKEQTEEINQRIAMIRQQRDEANDTIALLRIELNKLQVQVKACKLEEVGKK